ncbi:MAG TPA: GIY-YIG nuclease family protein [Chitinophagaceae bacterium]|nr:GIY-YIG nuclease family protein [Chitinophagaceae bacterium]
MVIEVKFLCHAGLDPAPVFVAFIMAFFVYIMSNYTRTVLYTGVTNDLLKRVMQHKNGQGSIFTSKYKCYSLVYYEEYMDANSAIAREKQLKKWHRQWKIELITKNNPAMLDLATDWF